MCCFSEPIEHVSATQIFARQVEGGQALAYAMRLTTSTEVAMVLPVPTPPNAAEDALKFVSLEGYSDFFDDLCKLFPVVELPDPYPSDMNDFVEASALLAVHRVGAFEASFVPKRADFGRLDPRFRLDDDVLDALPHPDDWGFAVFKLRPKPPQPPSATDSGPTGIAWLDALVPGEPDTAPAAASTQSEDIHPMAFVFETRMPDRLFFPTVHVHDGQVPKHASYDHQLFFQAGADATRQSIEVPHLRMVQPDPDDFPFPEGFDPNVQELQWSSEPLAKHVDAEKAAGIVDGGSRAFRVTLIGTADNRDVEIGLSTPAG